MNTRSMKAAMKAAAVALIGAAAGVLAPACADNESSLFIRACLVPDEQCVVEPSTDSVSRQHGLVDVARTGGGYRCFLLLGNQLAPLGNDSLRTETSRIQVYAFDVSIRDAAADPTAAPLVEYTTPAAGFVDPGQAPEAGYGAVDALLLDAQTAANLAGQGGSGFLPEVLVSVVARGRTLGGTEVESAPWQFPITVCNGCTCQGLACDPGSDATADCLFGLDNHCRFVDTDCP